MNLEGSENVIDLIDKDDHEQFDQTNNHDDEYEATDDEGVSSSSAAERVLSVLKHSLSLVQIHQALEDRTELQVKLCYNHRLDKWVYTVE